jgi:AcrR family transcriptional regulator
MQKSEINNGNFREIILTGVLDLLAEKGFYGFSVNDIIRHCGIHKSTLYYHFMSKTDVIASAVNQAYRQCAKEIFPVLRQKPSPTRHELFALLAKLDNYFKRYHKQYKVMMLLALELGNSKHDLIYQTVKDYFIKWREMFFYLFKHCSMQKNSKQGNASFAQFIGNLWLDHLDIQADQATESNLLNLMKVTELMNTPEK